MNSPWDLSILVLMDASLGLPHTRTEYAFNAALAAQVSISAEPKVLHCVKGNTQIFGPVRCRVFTEEGEGVCR